MEYDNHIRPVLYISRDLTYRAIFVKFINVKELHLSPALAVDPDKELQATLDVKRLKSPGCSDIMAIWMKG